MNHSIFYIVIVVLMFTACERQEDVDLKVPYKRKLVASVFIGAGDSLVRATLSYTTPVFGAPPAIDIRHANAATGVMQYRGMQTGFVYDSIGHEHQAIISPYSAVAGEAYQFVFTDDLGSVRGTTVIPQPVDLTIQLRFDSTQTPDFPVYVADLTYSLQSAVSSYIKLLPVLMLDDSFSLVPMVLETFNPMVLMRPGESVTSRFVASASLNGLHGLNLRCLIITCDEAYAKHYNATQTVDLGTVLPGSEPTQFYSNMSNGIGVVASYNICGEQVFQLK
ncbi:MAG: hypothetical protein V4590_10640 [Bacteroidota bacterium]